MSRAMMVGLTALAIVALWFWAFGPDRPALPPSVQRIDSALVVNADTIHIRSTRADVATSVAQSHRTASDSARVRVEEIRPSVQVSGDTIVSDSVTFVAPKLSELIRRMDERARRDSITIERYAMAVVAKDEVIAGYQQRVQLLERENRILKAELEKRARFGPKFWVTVGTLTTLGVLAALSAITP